MGLSLSSGDVAKHAVFHWFIWRFDIFLLILPQNMRRLTLHIVAHRISSLCIYTKEIIGLTSAGMLLRYQSFRRLYVVSKITQFFTDVCITQENGIPYLNALFKGHRTVCERILPLDAERYQKGELPLSNMLHKYCSYLMARDQKTAKLFRWRNLGYAMTKKGKRDHPKRGKNSSQKRI